MYFREGSNSCNWDFFRKTNSPIGGNPTVRVGGAVIFENSVILEHLQRVHSVVMRELDVVVRGYSVMTDVTILKNIF